MSREIVDQIQQTDRTAFYSWAESHDDHMPCLDLSPEASRYFIPNALYELGLRPDYPIIQDPAALNTLVREVSPESFAFFIVERRNSPVSNWADLAKFHYDAEDYIHRAILTGRRDEKSPVVPSTVDEYHALFADDVLDGLIDPRDFITHFVHLQKMGDELLHAEQNVVGYTDRIRRMGIGPDFYSRLDEIASRMHFRYVTGQNNPNNVSFFVEVLGRIPLSDLPTYRQRIISRHHGGIPNKRLFTVSLLDPADRARWGRKQIT